MLSLPPTDKNQHEVHIRFADWVEINLVVGEEPVVSVTDLAAALTADPPDSADDSEIRERFSDDAEQDADDAFAELDERAKWLTESYPLAIDGGIATVRDAASHLDLWRFVALLRARQLYPGALGDDGVVSGELFEELTSHAVGTYIGAGLEERIRFGVAGGRRGGGLPQQLRDAIPALSALMHERPGTSPTRNGGDYKADAIAWRPFGDKRGGQTVMIGQATISEGRWMQKEPARKWTDSQTGVVRAINFIARPLTAVAFVETLSTVPDDTLNGLPSSFSSVPFDRLRLLSVLSEGDLPQQLQSDIASWVDKTIERLPR